MTCYNRNWVWRVHCAPPSSSSFFQLCYSNFIRKFIEKSLLIIYLCINEIILCRNIRINIKAIKLTKAVRLLSGINHKTNYYFDVTCLKMRFMMKVSGSQSTVWKTWLRSEKWKWLETVEWPFLDAIESKRKLYHFLSCVNRLEQSPQRVHQSCLESHYLLIIMLFALALHDLRAETVCTRND